MLPSGSKRTGRCKLRVLSVGQPFLLQPAQLQLLEVGNLLWLTRLQGLMANINVMYLNIPVYLRGKIEQHNPQDSGEHLAPGVV